jgi:predicted outer membrane protein
MSAPKIIAIALTAFVMLATNSLAQQNFQKLPQRYEANKPVANATTQAGANSADSQLAACLIVDNQGEIALGKLAEQKSKDNDVKQFAQQMVKEHTDFMQKLERFATEQGAGAAQANSAVQNMANATQPMGSQPLNLVSLKQQIGQKCLEMTQQELGKYDGIQFDKWYVGQQIGAHMQVLAELEVFRNQASPELASLLDKGIATTKTHLEQAKTLEKSLNQVSQK